MTSKTEGCAANIHAAQSNAALFTKMNQDHTLALVNLVTAKRANRTSVALLTKTISELSIQVTHLTAKLATAQAENARLKNWDIVQPQPSTAIRRPTIRPRQIQPQAKTEMCNPRADKNLTLTVNVPPTATRWRKHTYPRLVASQRMGTKSWLLE